MTSAMAVKKCPANAEQRVRVAVFTNSPPRSEIDEIRSTRQNRSCVSGWRERGRASTSFLRPHGSPGRRCGRWVCKPARAGYELADEACPGPWQADREP